jgi:hypothetical protein
MGSNPNPPCHFPPSGRAGFAVSGLRAGAFRFRLHLSARSIPFELLHHHPCFGARRWARSLPSVPTCPRVRLNRTLRCRSTAAMRRCQWGRLATGPPLSATRAHATSGGAFSSTPRGERRLRSARPASFTLLDTGHAVGDAQPRGIPRPTARSTGRRREGSHGECLPGPLGRTPRHRRRVSSAG